jgi:hypothetical protein
MSATLTLDCCCYSHLLPAELVAIVRRYYQLSIDDDNLRNCVKEWRASENFVSLRQQCILKHGHISDWDTSQVTNMKKLFAIQETFNDDISAWDTGNVTDMSLMFHYARQFNQPIGRWNVANVMKFCGMFVFAIHFNQPLEQWDVRSAESLSGTFFIAEEFNQSLERAK